MADFNGPNTLPNRIPHDENENAVAVLYYYEPTTKKYYPVNFDNGVQLVATGPREPNYEIMHNQITVADTTIPTDPLGLFDFSGYSNIIVDIKLEGVASYVTLLPLYWNPVTGIYHVGQSQKFLSNDRIYADAAGCSDIYFLPIEVQGTVTVVVAGA